MPRYRIDFRSSPGQAVTTWSGLHDHLVPQINKHWRKRKDGVILGVRLEELSAPEWEAVGVELVTALLSLGTVSGLYASGDLPLEALLTWTRRVAGTHAEGMAALRWMARPNAYRRWNDEYARWCFVQPSREAEWLTGIWADMGSQRFHVDTYLILAVYDTDVSQELEWEESATIDSFGRTLRHALGWVVPIDDNLGFIVGVPVDSPLHDRLIEGG